VTDDHREPEDDPESGDLEEEGLGVDEAEAEGWAQGGEEGEPDGEDRDEGREGDEEREDEDEGDEEVEDGEDGEDEGDEDGEDGERRKPADRRRGPRPAHVVALALFFIAAAAYALNGSTNVHARERVIERCLAEDARLELAIAERSELRLPVADWMVVLYQARRRYVGELCDRTIDELAWWRWNVGRAIEADVGRASAQEISEVLEGAAASCEEEVRAMEEDLGRHVERSGPDPTLAARVREVTVGQLDACAELRRAVSHSRPGFWPPLRAESVARTPDALADLMPAAPSEGGGTPKRGGADE
jgi:hypothetical protein